MTVFRAAGRLLARPPVTSDLVCPECEGVVRHATRCPRRVPAREVTAPGGFCVPAGLVP